MNRISFPLFSFFFLAVMVFALSGCVTTGSSSTAATGAAAGGTSVGAPSRLEYCAEPLGTLAVDDNRMQITDQGWAYSRHEGAVLSIEPLLRLAIQQSNCFVITSAGNIRTDSRLQRLTEQQRYSGEYRAGSRQQKGQRIAVDYFLEPSVVINNDPRNQIGVNVARAFGTLGAALGAGLESKVSVVTLSLFDVRSTLQLAISEGSASATNFDASIAAFGRSGEADLSGLSRTPEGKATIAAFLDAYNKMVIALRDYKAQDVEGGMGTGGRLRVN